MKTANLVVLAAMLAGACVNRTTVQLPMSADDYARINRRLTDNKVMVRYNNGRYAELEQAYVRPDSVTGAPALYLYRKPLGPLSDMSSLEFRSSGKGALQGAAIGALAGAVLYGVLAADAGFGNFSGTVAWLGGTLGALVGAPIGAVVKARMVFEVQPARTASR